MKAVAAPDWDTFSDYDDIIADKRFDGRSRLVELRPIVHQAHRRYRMLAIKGALHRHRPADGIGPTDSDLLHHCYRVRTESLQRLKLRLRGLLENSGCNHCPYCGFGEITCYDHYLPQSKFPELSVCADNLIPCCGRCNELRGAHDWTPGLRPAVIHIFHEPIDAQTAFLEARIDVGANPVQVFFSVLTDPTNPFSMRLHEHFRALDLASRFAHEVIDEIVEFIEDVGSTLELHPHGDLTPLLVRRCASKANSRRKLYGANHWKVAFYRAAAESEEFIEYLLRHGARA